jgi:hypothetical protein
MSSFSVPVFIGFLFSAIGLATLFLSGEVLTAAIWLSFGNGLIVSGLRFKHTNEFGQVAYAPVPKIRIYTGVFLIVLAVVLLTIQITSDLQTAPAAPVIN